MMRTDTICILWSKVVNAKTAAGRALPESWLAIYGAESLALALKLALLRGSPTWRCELGLASSGVVERVLGLVKVRQRRDIIRPGLR